MGHAIGSDGKVYIAARYTPPGNDAREGQFMPFHHHDGNKNKNSGMYDLNVPRCIAHECERAPAACFNISFLLFIPSLLLFAF